MPLTAQQQTFLDNYVHKHSIKGRGKKARAKVFESARDRVVDALISLPQAAPGYAAIKLAMDAADTTAEQLSFKAAATQMDAVLASIKQAVAAFDPLPVLQDLDAKVTQVKNKAQAALPALPTLTGFLAPTGSAALRTACTTAANTVPVLAQGGNVADWAALMKTHVDAQALHVTACELALEQSRRNLGLVKGPTSDSVQALADFNAKIKDVAKACVSRPQRTALTNVLSRMKTEVREEATFAPIKNPADNKQFMDYRAAFAAPIETERTALQQATDNLKALIQQWRDSVSAALTQGQKGRDQPNVSAADAGLSPTAQQTLTDVHDEMTTGDASEKGVKTAGRRADGVVKFEPKAFFAVRPPVPYVAPADGAPPDPGRIANLKTAATALMTSFLQGPGAALTVDEKFDLSLKSPTELGMAYAVAQGWKPKKLTDDQKAVCAAIGEGLFESVRATTTDKLDLQGPNPQLTLGGKTYGTPVLLGQGGMGKAMRYTDPTDGSSVVVKTLLQQNEKTRAGMVKEIETQRYLMGGDDDAVGRDNVVGLQGAVTDEAGNLHMVMEVVAGGDLEDNRMGMMVAAQLDALPEEARSALQQATIKQAVEGLMYLRDQNVVHFDIKGANIFLGADGQAKLADFGSSKVNTTADGSTTWDTPGTSGYDGGAAGFRSKTDDRFDTFAMGKVIEVMQTNAAEAGRKPPPQLTGAIKRLTEAMTAPADQRPTLEAVLESSYIKNLDAYDPADIQALQAKSVEYAAALRKEMPAVRPNVSPPVLAAAAEWNRTTTAAVSFTEVCGYCRSQIDKAQAPLADLLAKRDAVGVSDKDRFDLQRQIDEKRATIALMNDTLALFGQSPAAQQLATEMKDISKRMTGGAADVMEDSGDMQALMTALEGSEGDPGGFSTVVNQASWGVAFEQAGIDLASLRELVSRFGMDVSADNPAAAAQVKALRSDAAAYMAAFPSSRTLSQVRRAVRAGLEAIVAAVEQRQRFPALDRQLGGLASTLARVKGAPDQFEEALADARFKPAFDFMGVKQAAMANAAGAYRQNLGPDNPGAEEAFADAQAEVQALLKKLPRKGPARDVAAQIREGFGFMLEAMDSALTAATA